MLRSRAPMSDLRRPTDRSHARVKSLRASVNRSQKWSTKPRAHLRPNLLRLDLLRPDLATNHRREGWRPGCSSAWCWRRASLSLPWFCSPPMAPGPSWLSPVGPPSSFQHCRRKIRRYPPNRRHLPFKQPQRKQHHRKQRHCLRPHRMTPHRQLLQRFLITQSCCNRWRAILRI